MRRYLLLALTLMMIAGESFAAKQFMVGVVGYGRVSTSEIDCQSVLKKLMKPYILKDSTCSGFEQALEPSSAGQFVVINPDWCGKAGCNGYVSVISGGCKAGSPAGNVTVPMYYTVNGEKVKTIRTASQVSGSVSGCKVHGVGTDGVCIGFPKSNNATLMSCGVDLQETGDDGGADGVTDDDPGYDGSPPATGGGAGTDPGGGDGGGSTGGGSTGGGSTGGGSTGGGSTGGGSTGGGSTGGGSTGGGSTGGGTGAGTGSGGNGQTNCGAPGQPACNINENGTPDGKGLMDTLTKWLDDFGDKFKKNVEDSISDQGKDTSIPQFMHFPNGVCVNPIITLPMVNVTREVDVCSWLLMLIPLFESFWSFSFAFAIMAMLARATAAKK